MFLLKLCVMPLVLNIAEGARILAFFPVPSISHQVVFRPMTQELAKRGHEVVILTPDPAFPKGQTPPNLTEIDLHDVSYKMWRESFVDAVDGDTTNALNVIRIGFKKVAEIFEVQIKIKEVKELIDIAKFDLVLVEACVQPALIMSHVFNAPLIQVSSFGAVEPNYETVGAPGHPLYHPGLFRNRSYNLTLWEKIYGLYEEIEMFRMQNWFEEHDDALLKKNFGPNAPSLHELRDRVEMLFLNINPIWEGNRAVPSNVIHLGGLHQKPAKDLPKELKSYLDASTNGVIYMSFGTNVDPSKLPPERIQIFCKVFSRLHYDVLWKWNDDDLPGKPENVRISKWLPQADLLRHPKVKLFITQAGLQSTDEAISAGVPLIAFPMLGDQWYNAEKYEKHGIGLNLKIHDLTEKTLETAVRKVIGDPSYQANIVRLGALMRDQPQSPLSRAAWWIEHVLRHRGARHLRAPLANATWGDFLMIDVLLVLLLILMLGLVVCGLVVYLVFKFVSFQWLYSKLKDE